MTRKVKSGNSVVVVPEKAKATIQGLFAQKQRVEEQLSVYVQGLMAALNLEGEWTLDVKTMTLVKVEEPGEPS